MHRGSSLAAAVVAAAAFASGCGASSSDERPPVTMDRSASAAVAHAEAVAEGGEGAGYETRANKAWQSGQNGYERLRRERCRARHRHSACHIEHVKLRSP